MIKPVINKMCLLTLSTSVLLACQPDLPTPNIDNTDDVRGNCSIYGHRKLANLGLPFNRFSGSYFSKKILRTKTSNYEWYPLQLSISESSSSTGKGQGSIGSTTQQCEEVLDLLLNRQYLSADEKISNMDIELTYPNVNYETIFDFDEGNVEAKIATDVTPTLSIHFEVLEFLLSGTSRIISEKEIDVGPINCETSFRVVAGWQRSDFNDKIYHDAQDSNMSGDFFHFMHEAEFTGENCTFEFEDTFQLKNNQLVPAKVFGGLKLNMEDGEQKGYDFVVYGIEI